MPARSRLTVFDFERLGDAAELRVLLARGVSPNARIGAERYGVDRAPLWIAACRAGPEALQVLLESGCSFEPAQFSRSSKQSYFLPHAVASGPTRALWALCAAKAGAIPLHALGSPNELWSAFHTLCTHAQETHELHSFLDNIDPPGHSDAYRLKTRADYAFLHALIHEHSGPSDSYELCRLAPLRLYWVLALHLEASTDTQACLAQELCNSRLPTDPATKRITETCSAWTWLLGDAVRAGRLLAGTHPHIDLAVDAARGRVWEVAFACAAGARAEQASDEPLAVFVRHVFQARAEPSFLSCAILVGPATRKLSPTALESALMACSEELTASGSLFSRPDRFGLSASMHVLEYENGFPMTLQTPQSSVFSMSSLSPLPLPPTLPLCPFVHLRALILTWATREELGVITGLAPRTGPRSL